MTGPSAYGIDADTLARAERIARKYPALEEIRADATRRRQGMARVMHAEPDPLTGWADAARCEYRAQGVRHSAAERAGTVVAILADFGGITLGTYDVGAWTAVKTIAAELAVLADAALSERPYYQQAADHIPDCPTPYAHHLAHHPEELGA